MLSFALKPLLVKQCSCSLSGVTDLLWTIFRSRQPVSLFQQVYQMVYNHLALLFISHLVHKHLEQKIKSFHLALMDTVQ